MPVPPQPDHRDLARSPHEVGECDDPADELLRLACLDYGHDTAARWVAAAALLAADPSLAGRSLHTAAATGDAAATERLLADGAAVDEEGGPFRWVPLLYLAYSRIGVGEPLAVARLLLEAGADPNAGYLWEGLPSPFTALTGAFGRGEQAAPPHPDELDLARLLLEAGAEANDSQTIYNRGLGDIATDDTGWLELLLEFGLGRGDGGPWKARLGDEHQTPTDLLAEALQHAAESGLERRVGLLLAAGADPDEPGRHPTFDGRRPYEGAVRNGNLAIAERLAAAGADTSGVDDLDRFVGACMAGDPTLARAAPAALVDRARAQRPDLIADAAELGRIDAVRLLAELGFDVDARPRATALHKAAWRDDRALVDALLDLGADPTIPDTEFDSPPAGWAAHGGHVELARYLEARQLVHANSFLTLATADGTGAPWATPVWFAHEGLARFVWVSRPGARHSQNVAARPEVGIVLFDSTVRPGDGRAVYLDAVAGEVPDDEVDAALATFSARSVAQGLAGWERSDVTGDAPFRLYAARPSAVWVLDDHDQRQEVH